MATQLRTPMPVRMRCRMRGCVCRRAAPAGQAELPQAVDVHQVGQLQAAQLPAGAACLDGQAAQAAVVLQARQVGAAGMPKQGRRKSRQRLILRHEDAQAQQQGTTAHALYVQA